MRDGSREAIFWLQIIYLLMLLGIGYLYVTQPGFLRVPALLGTVPAGVPWFGALGAVIISLTGVFQHSKDWDPSYKFWHWSRPLVGAAIAVVAVLILQAGLFSVGQSPQGTIVTPTATPTQPQQSPERQNILYYIVAFIVAYREETFRELIKRATDIILAPATPPVPPSTTSMTPLVGTKGDFVTISGTGLTGTTQVTFGSTPAFFRIDSDTQVTVTVPAGTSGATVPVIVSSKGGSSTADQFTYK